VSGSGSVETSIWDDITSWRPDAALTATLESGAGAIAGVIPGVSTAVSAANTVYHTGSAIYDGFTGDRDGAVAHGTQALVNGVGCFLPGAVGMADAVVTSNMMGVRDVAQQFGADPTQIPASFADMASFAAVAGTNAIFGPDDSNWIAPGDKPTGTRGGEIAAGAKALGMGMFGAIDVLSNGNTNLQDILIDPALAIGEYFGADLDGPTSGVRGPDGGSYAQKTGDAINKWATEGGGATMPEDLFPHTPAPFGPPIEVPVSGPTLPVAPDDLLY
jgi:hypothetical protein